MLNQVLALLLFTTGSICLAAPAIIAAPTTSVKSTSDALFNHLFVTDVAKQLARMTGKGESDFRVQVDSLKLEPDVPENISTFQIHVLGLGSQGARRIDGLFNVTVIAERGEQTQQYTATGIMHVIGPVVVAKVPLQRDQRVGAADVMWKTMAWNTLATGVAATSMEAIVGQKVKTLVQEGDAIYYGNLEEPMAVSNGDAVEITVFSGPGVIIRSRGVARQAGKIGDLIRVEQPDTKKMLSGMVSGQKAIEVRL